jgi:hypothetical protein
MVVLHNSALKVAIPVVPNLSREGVPVDTERCYPFCGCHSNGADFIDWIVIRHTTAILFVGLRKLKNRLHFV